MCAVAVWTGLGELSGCQESQSQSQEAAAGIELGLMVTEHTGTTAAFPLSLSPACPVAITPQIAQNPFQSCAIKNCEWKHLNQMIPETTAARCGIIEERRESVMETLY